MEKKKIYLAGPLFTQAERNFLEEINNILKQKGFTTYLPHKDAGILERGFGKSIDFFKKDMEAIKNSEILVAILNGSDTDSGTSWEIGFAYANKIPIIGILEDTRKPDKDLLNPMIINSTVKIVKYKEEIIKILESLK